MPENLLTFDDSSLPPLETQSKPSLWDRSSLANFTKMRAAFSNPDFASIGLSDEDGKRQSLTAYYANMDHQNIPFVYKNLDSFIEHYHGKPMSVDQAYGEVSNILNSKPDTYQPGGVEGVSLQISAMSEAAIGSIYRSFRSIDRAGSKALFNLTGTMHKDEWMAEKTADLKETDKFLSELKPFYDSSWDTSTLQTLETKGVAAGVKKMVADVIVSAPKLGIYMLSGPAAPGIIGTEAAADRYNDLDMNSSGLSEPQKITSALIDGVSNGVFFGAISYAKVLGVPLTGKVISDAKSGVYSALWDFAKKNAIQTSQPELVAATNWFTNKFLDIPNKEGLAKTLYETGIENLLPNAMFAGYGTMHFAKYETARAKMRNTLLEEKKNLLAIENPTNAEVRRLNTINDVLESRDMDKAMQIASFESVKDAHNQRNREISLDPERFMEGRNPEDKKTAGKDPSSDMVGVNPEDTMSSEEISQKAIRDYGLSEELAHHPDDTIQAVENLQTSFPGMKVKAIADLSKIPEAVLRQAQEEGHDIGRLRALPVDGTVYVNPYLVKPNDVPHLVLEEWVGHVGIREAFKGRLDPLLDRIANTKEFQPEIAKFAEKYAPEDANIANKYDVTTPEGMRNAAAEFLAHGAVNEIKPSRWNELLFHVKQFLRKIPGLADMRLTDRELEGILSKAYRHMMRQKPESVKFSLAEKNIENYRKFLDGRIAGGVLKLEKNQRARLEEAYNNFPIGESFENKWGEQLHFIPRGNNSAEEYIHHFLIKRGQGGGEVFSNSHLELFNQFIQNAKNPDDRILSMAKNTVTGKDEPRVFYVKQLQNTSGYHTIVAIVEETTGKILSWTHFDSKEGYVNNKLIKPERGIVEKYGLMDKDGNKLDLSYEEYLQQKKLDIPLYLATDGGLTTSQPQAAPSSPKASIPQSSGKSRGKKQNVDFSLSPRYSERQMEAMAKFLWPAQEKMKGDILSDEAALRLLREAGFKVHDEADAHMATIRARDMIRDRNNRITKAAKDKWRTQEYPILSELRKAYGENVKIKPSTAFKGEYESDFINSKKGKNTVLSDEAAKKLGVTEEELFSEIGKLKGVDMEKAYQDYRQNKTGRRGKIAKMQRELQEQGNFFAAYEIVHGDQPLNDWIIKNQPKVAEQVFMQVMGEPMPEGKTPDWNAVRAKLAEERASRPGAGENATEGAPKYGEGISYEKFKRMEIALNRALEEKTSLQDAQKAASDMAMEIPVDRRGAFLHRIAGLSNFTDIPTPAYPEGRRAVELERLLGEMSTFTQDVAKLAIIEKINKRLDQTELRRIGKGRVVSLEGDQQPTLDKIRDITRMSPETINSLIEAYREMAAKKMSETDDKGNFTGSDPSEYQYEIHMLETFGDLAGKSPDDLGKAFKLIDETARFGRNQVRQFIDGNRARYQQMRDEMINIITGGKGLMSPQNEDRTKGNRTEGVIKKTNLASKDLESMFQLISNNDKRLLKDTILHTDFLVKVHQSYQRERAEMRESESAVKKAFDAIFSTTGDWSRADLQIKLLESIDNTGIFRHQRDMSAKNLEKWLKVVRVTTEEGRILLRNYDETGKGMTDYQAEALRHQIAEKDQKFKSKLPVAGTGDEFIDAVLLKMQDEKATDHVIIPEIHNPGALQEQRMNKLQALHAWLMWQQPSLRYKMRYNGWTDKSIEQLEKFMSPDAKFAGSQLHRLGEWMVDELKNDLPGINEVCEKLWLSSLQGETNYFPGSFDVRSDIQRGGADISGAYSGNATVTPGAIYARRFHLKEPKYENALSVFMRHKMEMAHFKSHAEIARDMAAVFGNYDVQKAIRQYHGDETFRYLQAKINDVVNSGNRNAWKNAAVDAFQAVFAKTRIFWNTISMIKQAVGAAAYVNKIPVDAFLRGQMDFWVNPMENARILMETDYFKNRFHGGGMDRDMNIMTSSNMLGAKDKANRFSFLDEWGSLPTRAGDAFASIAGGYAVYKYHFDKLVSEGITHAEAHKQALLEWELATERTQQTASPAYLNRMQLGDSFSRTFTTFMGNPILLMNDFLNAAQNVYHGRGTPKERAALAAKTGFTAFILGGLVMSAVSQAAKHGGNVDDYEVKRMLKDTLFSPFAAYNIFGFAGDAAFGQALGIPDSHSTAVDDLGNIGRTVRKLPEIFSGDMEEEDVYKTVEKSLIALGMTGEMGIPGLKQAAPLSTNSSAVMRELRRYWNIFFEKEKTKKNKPGLRW